MAALPLSDPSKAVELRGGPLDGLRIRVASGINGSWLPTLRGDALVLVEYYKPSMDIPRDQEVWLYKPSVR
ncbi:MAG TPA: hypothetical protein VF107_03095 [Burkholderiaceae bacterium]